MAPAAFLLTGCLARTYIPHAGPAVPRARALPAGGDPYAYQPMKAGARLTPAHRGIFPRYRVYELELPSAGENGQEGNRVEGLYYRSNRPGPRPLVIVLPIWGSSTFPPRVVAYDLMGRGEGGLTHVLRLRGRQDLFDWDALANAESDAAFARELDRAVERLRVTVVDVRRILDWAGSRPEVDRDRIGLVGFSIGAVAAGVVLGVDSRVAAAALVMGGGNLHEVLATCPGEAGRMREAAMRRFGWSRAEFAERCRRHVEVVNPVRYAGRVDPERILLFDSARDECIPESARGELWRALGRPDRYSFAYRHRTSFLSMTILGLNFTRRRIGAFFEDRLFPEETGVELDIAREAPESGEPIGAGQPGGPGRRPESRE